MGEIPIEYIEENWVRLAKVCFPDITTRMLSVHLRYMIEPALSGHGANGGPSASDHISWRRAARCLKLFGA